jgi:hypothetical protein
MRIPKKSIGKKNKYTSLTKKWSKMRSRSKANALHTICYDSNFCMAIGKSYNKILNFFNDFHSFAYVSENIHRIGKKSSNGVIYQIKYHHRDYDAYAVLKSSIDIQSDNLMYEYMVGMFLNRVIMRTLCFIGTFGMFKYNTQNAWNQVTENMNYNIDNKFLMENLSNIMPKINTIQSSCINSHRLCILIENIPSAKSLHDMKKRNDFIQNDFIYVYYQIYAGLVMLEGNFVHNDLHNDNVLLYEPYTDKYFIFEYHLHDKITTFYSPYIAKIIDYGRSYFNENKSNNSTVLLKKICSTDECFPRCGDYNGYHYINYFNNGIYAKNISADLRLISYSGSMKKTHNSYNFMNFINNISKKVIFKNEHSTPTNKKRGYPKSINNIYDAYDAIYDFMTNPDVINENKRKYVNSELYTCKGKFVIYDDGRNMEYYEI